MIDTRISRLFERLREQGRKGLIAYLTAGDPAPDRTASLVEALERGGADLIELGVPFSDPIADGPVIQRGAERALKAGTRLRNVLDIARQVRRRSQIPLLLFTYLNPVMRYGFNALASDAAAAGIDGCLLTDLSVEEAEAHVGAMRRAGLDTVFLAAPTSPPERLRLVAKYSSGFAYLVSRTGVTGESSTLSDSVAPLVAAMREVSDLPLAVGFGDAAVVGTAFVRLIEQNLSDPALELRLEQFTRELAAPLREGKP